MGTPKLQAPIHGSYHNSGNFSLTRATDARHVHGHQGVDLRAAGGTVVYPMASGRVSNVGTDPKGGNVVFIDYGGGLRSYYAHLGTVSVQKGDVVDVNTPVATISNSGNAKFTAPHLHLGISIGGSWVDPARFIPVPPYSDIGRDEILWLPEAKERAARFDMQQHLQQRAVASLALQCERFLKLCG